MSFLGEIPFIFGAGGGGGGQGEGGKSLRRIK